MEGITILTSEEVCVGMVPSYTPLIIFALIGLLIGVCVAIKCSYDIEDAIGFIIIPFVGGCLIGGLCSLITGTEIKEVHYQATISDEVSLKDFNEKYEIIEQKGDLYTIKEKEENITEEK